MPAKTATKVSAASIIKDGILADKSTKQILAIVHKKIDTSKADESHIKFYARQLLKTGKLGKTKAADRYGIIAKKETGAKKEKESSATKRASSSKKEVSTPKRVQKSTATNAKVSAKKKPVAKKSVNVDSKKSIKSKRNTSSK